MPENNQRQAKPSLERTALALALTEPHEEMNELRKLLLSQNVYCAVTELGGTYNDLQPSGKLTHSVIAEAIHAGAIQKEPKAICAITHAIIEASQGIFVQDNSCTHYELKVGIASNRNWIAIAIFGRSSLHALSERCRVGLGYTHL
ncbi:HutP family protein [Desulfitobacterium sp. THU1]|uniref:HutP family protein n=1 Tax=Desulfitobacterium sp. THU1 TaxID=3138072 RepID=UPI00311FECC1